MFSFGPSGDGNKGGGEHLPTAVDNIQVKMLEGKDAGDLALLARKVRSKKHSRKDPDEDAGETTKRALGKDRLWQNKLQL